MPLIQVTTNLNLTEAEQANCLQTLSKAVAELLNKPEDFVMTSWNHAKMTFAGNEAPTIFVDLHAVRLPEDAPKRLTPELCERIRLTTEIQADRVYINFHNVGPGTWGWNNKTFD